MPHSLAFLRSNELEKVMRKTQEGDSPPKQPKIKNYLTKLDKWFIVDVAFHLKVERRHNFEGLIKTSKTVFDLLNCKAFRGLEHKKY